MASAIDFHPSTQSVSWFTPPSFALVALLKIDPPAELPLQLECSSFSTCFDCRSDSNCQWDVSSRTCSKDQETTSTSRRRLRKKPRRKTPDSCPAQKCERWSTQERIQGLDWIDSLPQCPCRVEFRGARDFRFLSSTSSSSVSWSVDPNCNPGKPCSTHPGALGCFRAPSLDPASKAGNQCCYDSNGDHISSTENPLAAGTPDRVEATFPFIGHYFQDVLPWKTCCRDSELASTCDLYTGAGGSYTTATPGHQRHPGVREDTRGCLL